jgi:hypothetical protein
MVGEARARPLTLPSDGALPRQGVGDPKRGGQAQRRTVTASSGTLHSTLRPSAPHSAQTTSTSEASTGSGRLAAGLGQCLSMSAPTSTSLSATLSIILPMPAHQDADLPD